MGATTSVGWDTVPAQSPEPSITLPTNRTAVLGNYYQWGRNDTITSGTFITSPYTGAFTSPANTTGNTSYYAGDATHGDWKWGGVVNPEGGWNTANGGNNQ